MTDLNQPSIFGYAITPWFIIVCICGVGIVCCIVAIVVSLLSRKKREIRMIDEAAKNTSKIKLKADEKDVDIDISIDTGIETESISYETSADTSASDTDTASFGVESTSFGKSEEVSQNDTEGLIPSTEAFDKTEGLNFETSAKKNKFCTKCGAKLNPNSKFCIKCGKKLH